MHLLLYVHAYAYIAMAMIIIDFICHTSLAKSAEVYVRITCMYAFNMSCMLLYNYTSYIP